MKFSYIVSALAMLPASASFAPANSRATSRTTSSLNGFLDDLCGDRCHTAPEQKKTIANRFQISIKGGHLGDFKMPTKEQEKENAKNLILEDNFKHMPTKSMTGVEEHITRFAATLSNQLYELNDKLIDKIAMSTDQHEVEVIIEETQGVFQPSSPTFAAVVVGDTMILGWRGTSGLIDGINDAAFSPCSSLAMRKHGKNVKLQGAMASLCVNDIAIHEQTIISECKKRGIKDIVTTGHSLGGGIGQVAHTLVRAQMEDPKSPWNELSDLSLRSVCFCAPMTTLFVKDNCPDATTQFIEELNENSVNVVFNNDPVPRGYGYLSFINDFVDDAIPDIVDYVKGDKPMPTFFIGKTVEKLAKAAEEQVLDSEAFQDIVSVISNYIHPGKLIYYKDYDAKPRLLTDLGAFHKNSGKKDTFRSVKYDKTRRCDSAIDGMFEWHTGGMAGVMYDAELLH